MILGERKSFLRTILFFLLCAAACMFSRPLDWPRLFRDPRRVCQLFLAGSLQAAHVRASHIKYMNGLPNFAICTNSDILYHIATFASMQPGHSQSQREQPFRRHIYSKRCLRRAKMHQQHRQLVCFIFSQLAYCFFLKQIQLGVRTVSTYSYYLICSQGFSLHHIPTFPILRVLKAMTIPRLQCIDNASFFRGDWYKRIGVYMHFPINIHVCMVSYIMYTSFVLKNSTIYAFHYLLLLIKQQR